MVSRLVSIVLGALCCGFVSAKPIEPPTLALRDSRVMLVSGVITPDVRRDRITLAQVETLRGEPEAEPALTVRIPAWTVDRVVPGERILVAYTLYRRDPTLPDRKMLDPQGPLALVSDGLEPALFRDDPQSRARLLTADGSIHLPGLPEVLDGLELRDPQWHNYYAHELAIRPELVKAIDAEALDRIERFLRNRDAHPSARAILFQSAAVFPATNRGWWHVAALDVLRSSPVALTDDPADGSVNLVRTVFLALEGEAAEPPVELAQRWVRSSSASLVESALLAVRRVEPAREEQLIGEALQLTLLPAVTRSFIIDHQRRLMFMRKALSEGRDLARD